MRPILTKGQEGFPGGTANACREDKFHIFAVDNIHDAIEIMTGVPAGRLQDGQYPDGTVLFNAVDRAHEFWKRTMSSPDKLTSTETKEVAVQSTPAAKKSNPKKRSAELD